MKPTLATAGVMMLEAEPDDRRAARNAWIDQQMAAPLSCQRSMHKTITAGFATGTATAVSPSA